MKKTKKQITNMLKRLGNYECEGQYSLFNEDYFNYISKVGEAEMENSLEKDYEDPFELEI